MVTAVVEGLGRQQYYVDANTQLTISKLLIPSQVLGLWAIGLTRISVACMLLYLPVSRVWKVVLQMTVVIQVAVIIVSTILPFVRCFPLSANWQSSSHTKCWTQQQMESLLCFYSSKLSYYTHSLRSTRRKT